MTIGHQAKPLPARIPRDYVTNRDIRTAIEAEIVQKLIGDILDAGYQLRVWDGEEYCTPRTTDHEVVYNALGSTDHDELFVYDAKNMRIGWVLLIWGNEYDVISDYTTGLTGAEGSSREGEPDLIAGAAAIGEKAAKEGY